MFKKKNRILDPQLKLVEQNTSALTISNKIKLSLYKKSVNSGFPANILEEVYKRGYSIWNRSFKGNPEQFAFDRVNSFIAGGFAADLDQDLRESMEPYSTDKNNPASRFTGSTEATEIYKNDTPGQRMLKIIKKCKHG